MAGAGQRGEGQAWGHYIHPPHTIASLAGLERSLRGYCTDWWTAAKTKKRRDTETKQPRARRSLFAQLRQ